MPLADPRAEDVRAYIGAVRAWLADLPAEEVEDLTLGMEADLAERAAENGGRLGELLGDPEAYAAELRAAAGLPPRAVPEAGPASHGFWARSVDDARRETTLRLEQWPWLRDLRPVWWLARGWVLGWAVAAVLGTGHVLVLPLLGAALSFWWGRRLASRAPSGAALGALRAANVLAVVLLLPAAVSVLDANGVGAEDVSYQPPAGLSLDGAPVSNLYVYDAQGQRVEGARILTPDGRGVFVDPTTTSGSPEELPYRPDGTPDVRNDVFPLVIGDRDPWADPGYGWVPPLSLTPLAVTPSSSPSASATGTASPTPTPTPPGG
ncbi:hypothetical protein ATL31_2288 [Phycicoccus duodecadis]|uniref:Uncharacterized protein n=2 Tax=Phycicoccus duodecadis TaxID=173053 RepID=A0A2N3YKR7_9MICO|nr:hypothetical protein ATL31_2288 [Phycicoccus duodecadis]